MSSLLSPLNEELIKSGTFLKYMLNSSALIFPGIDLILILGIILTSSAQNERGFVRDELLTSVKYSLFLSFIISVTVFLNFLYSFISESSFLFTANSWILSLLYMSLTIINKSALVLRVAWEITGDNPLSEPRRLLTASLSLNYLNNKKKHSESANLHHA